VLGITRTTRSFESQVVSFANEIPAATDITSLFRQPVPPCAIALDTTSGFTAKIAI
jgi:hypothetical protein